MKYIVTLQAVLDMSKTVEVEAASQYAAEQKAVELARKGSECDAWEKAATFVTDISVNEANLADGELPPIKEEFSVCVDCQSHVEGIDHGGDERYIRQRMFEVNCGLMTECCDHGRLGSHVCWTSGVEPTLDDPEGLGFDELSRSQCELCYSNIGAERYGVTATVIEEQE